MEAFVEKIFIGLAILFATNAQGQTQTRKPVPASPDQSQVVAKILEDGKVVDVCKGTDCKRAGKILASCSYLMGPKGEQKDMVCDVTDVAKKYQPTRYLNGDATSLVALMKKAGAVEDEEDICDSSGKCSVNGGLNISCSIKPGKTQSASLIPIFATTPAKTANCSVTPYTQPQPQYTNPGEPTAGQPTGGDKPPGARDKE